MINQFAASLVVATIAFWGVFQVYPLIFPARTTSSAQISLDTTIIQLKRELVEIAAAPGETAGLVLDAVKLELTAEASDSKGLKGELAVPVFDSAAFSAGDKSELKQGSKVTIAFDPSSGDILLSSDKQPGFDLSTLVVETRKALLATMTQPPKLVPKSVDIAVSFVFVRSREQGAKIEVKLLNVSSSASQSETGGNTIVLSYLNPLYAKDEGKPVAPR